MRFDYGSGGYAYETAIHGFVRPDGTVVRVCEEVESDAFDEVLGEWVKVVVSERACTDEQRR